MNIGSHLVNNESRLEIKQSIVFNYVIIFELSYMEIEI